MADNDRPQFPPIYNKHVAILEAADIPTLNAFHELLYSSCGVCENSRAFEVSGLIKHIIRVKEIAAA